MAKFSEIDLTPSQWTSISGNWSKREADFIHRPTDVSPNSFNFFICDKQVRDGAIEGTVRVAQGGDDSGRLVFRYGPSGCYYAGVGGYSRHFAIVKYVQSIDRAVSIGIALAGLRRDIRYEEPYHLRVEFIGDTITLKSSGVTVLQARDNWFDEGHIGLETYGQTKVEFSHLRAYEIPAIEGLLRILETFPYTLKRDNTYLKRELQDEKDVQRVLWTILRSHYSDLVDEEILGRFGLKHYQNDFGIPSLSTIIEVKVITSSTNLKALQEQLMTDFVGYFGTMTNYRHLVYFLYNKANRLIDSSFVRALESLDPVAAVVIVPGVKT